MTTGTKESDGTKSPGPSGVEITVGVAEGKVEVGINVEVGEAGATVEVTGSVGVDDPRTVMLVPT